MKKLLFYFSAIATLFMAGSCQKDTLEPASEGDINVTFTLQLPETVETKAMSQAESTDIVYYEIWNSDWTRQLYPVNYDTEVVSAPVSGKTAKIELTLVTNQTYNFIFWAQNEACGAYDVNELKAVKVDYDVIGAEGNQDKFDAFYATKTIRVDGPINETIVLYRPFAQLNFGADAMETTFGPVKVTDTEITVSNLATTFNTLTGVGEVETGADVTFTANGLATDEALVTGGKSYTWVAMDYMLMMNDQDVVDVEASFGIENMDEPVTHSIVNVPLKKNYRTNIVGNLFTTDAVLNIIVDPAFNAPDMVIGDAWAHLGDLNYVIKAGAPSGTLKAVLEQADADARVIATKADELVATITLEGDVDWETGAAHGSTPLLPEDSPITSVVINGNDKTFTATGKGVGPIRLANGALLVLNELKIVDLSESYDEGAWELGYLEMDGRIAMNGCEVVNAIQPSGEFAAVNTTFNSYNDNQYAVWVNAGKASFEACTFSGPRGLKMHEAYRSEISEVIVDYCFFDHISKKPGIAMGDLNPETKVVVKNSLFDGCQAGDQGLYMYETDTDVDTFDFTRENNIVIGYDEVAVEQEDGSLIAATEPAINHALSSVENDGVIRLANGEYDGAFLLDKDIKVTIKSLFGKGATIAGKLGVAYADVTLRDLNFKISANTAASTSHQYINKANNYIIPMYAADVTVEDCSFSGMNDAQGAIYYYAATQGAAEPEKLTVRNSSFSGERAIRSRSNVEVTGCTFTGLLNPCVQVLGLGDTDIMSKVVFTGNTSDNYVSGVTIKSGNYLTKNIEFNVGGNTRCNLIAYDGKILANLFPETYTYTGEVTTMLPEEEKGLIALLDDPSVSEIVLAPGEFDLEKVYYLNSGAKTIKSVYADNKALIMGKIVARQDVVFEDVAFAPNATSTTSLSTNTYGKYVNGSYASIVTVYKVNATFDGCEFKELHGDFNASAINYHQESTGKILTVKNSTFSGKNKAIYTKPLCKIENCSFDLNGGVSAYVWPRYEGNGEFAFKNNSNETSTGYAVGFLSQSAPFANLVFDVQGNTGYSQTFAAAAAAVFATDGSVKFADGSDTFDISAEGKML